MILLASKSPQRQHLLSQAGLRYVVIKSIDDDPQATAIPAQQLALERARAKARGADYAPHLDLLNQHQAAIIAADTVVNLRGRALGSPRDADEAKRMLADLAGTRHSVITAHCCYRPASDGRDEQEAITLAIAQVTMLPMSMEDIETYVASGESIGRAGGYAYQEHGDRFVADIQGDSDTVIGLHIDSVRRIYREVTGAHPEEDQPA